MNRKMHLLIMLDIILCSQTFMMGSDMPPPSPLPEDSTSSVPGLPPLPGMPKKITEPVMPSESSMPEKSEVPTPPGVLSSSEMPPAPVKPGVPSEPSMQVKPGVQEAAAKKDVIKSAQVTSGIDFKKEEEKENEEDKDVIDTVDVKSSGGNWVFKNYWWRKIEELYGEIKITFNHIMTARMSFFTQRSEVDKELDRFYQHVGLEQGPLEDIINLALEVMEKEKKDQGYLNKKERAFLEKVKDKQHQLMQLKEDVKAIEELDAKIDEALEVVLKQVDICNQYEQEAWQTFKNVARELSDKEARKQYYQVKGLLNDTQKVYQYLTGPFSNYFSQMIQGVQEHTQGIVAKLGVLKNDQVDLKKEAEFFEKEDEEFENAKAEKEQEKEEALKEEKASLTYKIKSWWYVLTGWFKTLWHHPIKFLKGLWSTIKKDATTEKEQLEKEVKTLEKEVSIKKDQIQTELKKEAEDVTELVNKEFDKVDREVQHEFDTVDAMDDFEREKHSEDFVKKPALEKHDVKK